MTDLGNMSIFELVDRLNSDKAAVLKELTLRFRKAAKEASERAHARGFRVADGRPGESLPPEEDWEGLPVHGERSRRKPRRLRDDPE